MPRTLEQNKKIKEASKKRIMEAALKVFGEYSYDRASISQIAKEAGISNGLMYNYFESKDELVLKIVENFLESHYREWINKIRNASSDFEKFVLAVDRYVIPLQEDSNKWKLIKELTNRKEFKDDVWRLVKPLREGYQGELEGYFKESNVNPDEGFWGLQTFLEGVASCYCAYGENYPIQKVRDQYVENAKKMIGL